MIKKFAPSFLKKTAIEFALRDAIFEFEFDILWNL